MAEAPPMNPTPGQIAYAEKLARPEWRLRRLAILERDSFTCRRCGISGVALEVHHLRYLPGLEPWDHPADLLESLCTECHALETAGNAANSRAGTVAIVNSLARAKRAFKKPTTPPETPKFDARRAWAWIGRIPDERVHRPLMKFAGWLWATGTEDMDVIEAILLDRCRRNPANAYAYYAPGGTARDCREAQTNIVIGEVRNDAFKAADREFLAEHAADNSEPAGAGA